MDLCFDCGGRDSNWLLAVILVGLGMFAWRMARTCHRRIRSGAAPMLALLPGTIALYVMSAILIASAVMAF